MNIILTDELLEKLGEDYRKFTGMVFHLHGEVMPFNQYIEMRLREMKGMISIG